MKVKLRYQLLLLLFIVLALYYPTLFGGANSVDDQRMLQGLLNSHPGQWINGFFHSGSNNYFRPLLMATFYADLNLWLLSESFIHLENILLHGLNTIWVFLLARELGRSLDLERYASWAPFCAALIFAVHPVNTEPVNWISGRTDILAGFFLLPAVWLLVRGLANNKPVISWLGGLLFLCACLSKETSVFIFPAGMFFCFRAWNGKPNRFWRDGLMRTTRYYWPWFAALGFYFVMRYAAKPFDKGFDHVVKVTGGEVFSLLDGLRIFFKAGGFYIKKLFFPWPLNFAIIGASNLYVPLGVLFIVAIIVWLRRHSLLSMIFLAMACLLSSAVLVALLNMTWTPLAERYLYLPVAFFAVGLIYYCAKGCRYFSGKQVLSFAFVPMMLLFSVSTYQRNIIWQDNLSLYQDTDRKTPNFPPIRNELALALIKNGRSDEGKAILAENMITKAGSEQYYSPTNNAIILWNSGQYKQASNLFWQTADEDQRNAVVILKKYLSLMDRWSFNDDVKPEPDWLKPEMIRVQQTLYERTHDPFWLYCLGKIHFSKGDRIQALDLFEQAYGAAPDSAFYKEPAGRFLKRLQTNQ